MSVQVRRRREAASFLSTYVGAQGEILVDTTNNRVQVHDGSTPGGWPAAGIGDLAGRNALINGNFAINQRGYASGTALVAGAYAHDRWKAGSGGCTYTFTQAVPDTAITITAGTLVQAIEGNNVTATSCWLSWVGTAQARVWQGSASGTYASSPILVTGLVPGTIANVELSTGTAGLVQLEAALPNAGPTRFERRQSTQEMTLCRQFYRTMSLPAGVWVSGTHAQFILDYSDMRVAAGNPAFTLLVTANLAVYDPGAPTTVTFSNPSLAVDAEFAGTAFLEIYEGTGHATNAATPNHAAQVLATNLIAVSKEL